jgi:hypothetical protein
MGFLWNMDTDGVAVLLPGEPGWQWGHSLGEKRETDSPGQY